MPKATNSPVIRLGDFERGEAADKPVRQNAAPTQIASSNAVARGLTGKFHA